MSSQRRSFTRRHLLAVVAATGALAIVAPVSGASAQITPFGFTPGGGIGGPTTGIAPSVCPAPASASIGPAGGTTGLACGDVLAFIGPAIGQVSNVVGPTIIGATILAPVTVSSGSAAAGSVP
jgi:hypothetical protein